MDVYGSARLWSILVPGAASPFPSPELLLSQSFLLAMTSVILITNLITSVLIACNILYNLNSFVKSMLFVLMWVPLVYIGIVVLVQKVEGIETSDIKQLALFSLPGAKS